MADFYQQMSKMASDLLAPTSAGGLGQGKIELVKTTTGAIDPAKPFDTPTTTTARHLLRGAVRGIGKEMIGVEVGGTVLLASDRQAICAVPPVAYTAGDSLAIDGKPVHVIAVQNIPEAGTVSAVRFIIRGY